MSDPVLMRLGLSIVSKTLPVASLRASPVHTPPWQSLFEALMNEEPDSSRKRSPLEASRSALQSTTAAVSKAMKKASGAEFRENWQEFSESVTSIVVGLHGENTALKARVAKLERQGCSIKTIAVAWAALVVALVALTVALL